MDDKNIVKHILNGETGLYAEVMHRYTSSVYSNVLRLVKDEDLAQDITQQAFIRAYTRLSYWSGDSLGGWLSSIALHLALNELERRRRRQTQPIDDNVIAETEDESFEEHERLIVNMEAAIEELPEQDRQLLRLHYKKLLKTDEIARRLHISQSNVLVRLHRIREKLKRILKEKNNG